MAHQPKLTRVEIKRGYWLYAGEIRKTVIIYRLNYDVYYEMEKDSFSDLSDETPHLNQEGYSYLIVWPEKGFTYPPGSWSVPPDTKALSLEEATAYAETTVKQSIDWIN
jgi:hypothetical protein